MNQRTNSFNRPSVLGSNTTEEIPIQKVKDAGLKGKVSVRREEEDIGIGRGRLSLFLVSSLCLLFFLLKNYKIIIITYLLTKLTHHT